MKKKVLVVFGTRPEAIKMCPLVKALQYRKDFFEVFVCVTGQHREMLEQVLDTFGVRPNYDLSIMKEGQTLFDITCEVLSKMRTVVEEVAPDVVLVHGDTTTSFSAALASFYLHVPVGHVEAGLRTHDIFSPWPEEFNRQAVDDLSTLFFAPTDLAKQNLIDEGKPDSRIFVTGNTGIDALSTTVNEDYIDEQLRWASDSKLVLLTAHRRENIGQSMRRMFKAIRRVVEENEDVKVLYPVHLNPDVRQTAREVLGNCERIRMIEPLDVLTFHNYLARCYLVLTDSGGIQEEAPALGVPVLVMRDTTERPEGVLAGTLRVVGTREDAIHAAFTELLTDKVSYDSMSCASNPYGNGKASEIIAELLVSHL